MSVTTPLASDQSLRILTLEGGCNFRDLGGYRTIDGREIRWGKVFRTGVLSYFTQTDQQRLTDLGVRVICDLRRSEERDRERTCWPDTNTQHLCWDDGATPPTIRSLAVNHPYTSAGMHATMIDLYRALPAWLTPRLRDMFARIVRGDVPILVHCAAGKDRTGIAIALLLTALDVPHETIVEDYLLTNTAGDLVEFILTRHEAHLGVAVDKHPLLTLPEDIRHVLFSAHADYLRAAFDQISLDHGCVAAYLRSEVGVDDSVLEQLKVVLLRSVSHAT
jgi:protein-tyrosine phosphatase